MKSRQRRLIPILAVMLLAGCIHKTGAPVTAKERIAVDNATFAEINNAVEQGTEAVVTSKVLSPAQGAPVIAFTGQVATAHLQITAILEKGVGATASDQASLQALIAQIQASGAALVNSGSLGIKNPKTQQTIAADVQALVNLAGVLLTQIGTLKGVTP